MKNLVIAAIGYAVVGLLMCAAYFFALRMGISYVFLPAWNDPNFNKFWVIFLIVLALIILAYWASFLILSYLLLKRKHRKLSIVLAAISCLSFPLGTILGVFTIYVLTRHTIIEQFPT